MQSSNYEGGKVLTSFISDESGGSPPDDGFFIACNRLKTQHQLHGSFVWSADDSRAGGCHICLNGLERRDEGKEGPMKANTLSHGADLQPSKKGLDSEEAKIKLGEDAEYVPKDEVFFSRIGNLSQGEIVPMNCVGKC
ncbi:Chitinase 1 [Vitis vinifera]|uniref:Chitinase 1 n=1 Tax=Vitis vinifera TaxID=29760 RepID=A0A438G0Z7_VITVI|nr:Chitinase 1 [Vitis vinifera]RVX23005.1 Chitinase 1 [Vitis vinifera]